MEGGGKRGVEGGGKRGVEGGGKRSGKRGAALVEMELPQWLEGAACIDWTACMFNRTCLYMHTARTHMHIYGWWHSCVCVCHIGVAW